MTNVENVIKNLNTIAACCKLFTNIKTCSGIDEEMYADWANTIDEAVLLLKEQEPILLENQHKPYGINTNANSPWISRCPKCGKKVDGKQTKFCKYCGQAVKWND